LNSHGLWWQFCQVLPSPFGSCRAIAIWQNQLAKWQSSANNTKRSRTNTLAPLDEWIINGFGCSCKPLVVTSSALCFTTYLLWLNTIKCQSIAYKLATPGHNKPPWFPSDALIMITHKRRAKTTFPCRRLVPQLALHNTHNRSSYPPR
jgi:hypothetical protein